MPNDDDGKQGELELGGKEETLPPVIPPQTKAPFQFKQQINIQQIPPGAWERLSPDQVVDLSKTMMTQLDKLDERHFNRAMDQAKPARSYPQKGHDYRSDRCPLWTRRNNVFGG